MQKAIEILEAILEDYKSQNRLVQAHVIYQAIQVLKQFNPRN